MIFRHNLSKLFILLFFSYSLFAIEGVVIDNENETPIIGARVSIVGTEKGAITDKYGRFNIETNSDSVNIEVVYVGYENYTKIHLNDGNIVIMLEPFSFRTNELVVSANKKVEAKQDVPISVSTIAKEQLSTRNITSIDFALQYVPGVEVNQDNVSIRGSSGFSFGIGSRAIFLQDGFPLLSADNNDIKFDIIPILFVDRVEVVKGAGSALFGTSALGGVVNVLTSEPEVEPTVRARVYSGLFTDTKYNQWNWSDQPQLNSGLDIGYSQKFNDYGLIASFSLFDQDSYKRFDKSERNSAFLKQSYDINDKSKIYATLNYSTSNTDDWVYWNSLDSALIPPTDTDESVRIKSDKLAFSTRYRNIITDNSLIDVRAGLFNTFFSNMLDSDNSEFRESKGVSYYIEPQYSLSFDDDNSIITGFELRVNEVESETYASITQSIAGAFVQFENKNIDNLIATVGLRADKEIIENIETNPRLSPKLGLNYKLSDRISLRGSFGLGFRVASLAERFATVEFQGFSVIENPNLKPEKSQSIELGVSTNLLKSDHYLNIDLSGFSNEFQDLIEPDFNVDQLTQIQFKNITEARINGAEINLEYKYKNDFEVNSSFTYLSPRDLTLDRDLKYRSNILFYNSFVYRLLPFQIQLDYRYKSQYNEIDSRLGLAINNHDLKIDAHILDISLAAFTDVFDTKTRFTLNVKNALNYYYLEMVGNMAPIRFINFQIETEL